MSQRTYEATLAIYVKGHTNAMEDIELEANDREEAERIAWQYADDMERRLSKDWPYDDFRVDVKITR